MNVNDFMEGFSCKSSYKSGEQSKDCFIKPVEGIVKVKTPVRVFELKVINDLYLHPAFEVEPGKFEKILKGIPYKEWVSRIYSTTYGSATRERLLLCIFLNKVQEAWEKNETFVSTPCGNYFLVYPGKEEDESSFEDLMKFL